MLGTRMAHSQKVKYHITVPSLISATNDGLRGENHPVEHAIVDIVRGNMYRARTILAEPGDQFDIDVALIGTHICPSFALNMTRLTNLCMSGWAQRALDLEFEELAIQVLQQGASKRRDHPSYVSIYLQRYTLTR